MDSDGVTITLSVRCNIIRSIRLWRCHDTSKALSVIDATSSQLRVIISKLKEETELNASYRISKQSQRQSSNSLSPGMLLVRSQLWFIRMKCLTDYNYIDESFILNEDEFDSGTEQIMNVAPSSRHTMGLNSTDTKGLTTSRQTVTNQLSQGRSTTTTAGMMTGKRTSHNSRQSSSYRPLTTGLTASQTAFSRSTESLIKYACQGLMAKPVFDYLYSVQKSSNKYPDFRQCLDYITSTATSTSSANSFSVNEEVPAHTRANISSTFDIKQMTPFWLISSGKCYYNLNMARVAESYFSIAINTNPWLIDAYLWEIKVFLKLGQPLKVIRLCEEGLKYHKNSSSILMNWLARTYSFMNKLYLANVTTWNVLKSNPVDLEALTNAGYFAFYNDQIEVAMNCFERIHQLSMVHAVTYEEFTDNEINKDNKLIGTHQLSVMSPQLLNNLALCYFYSGYLNRAIPIFLEAFTHSDSSETTSDIWYNLSFICLHSGFEKLATICLELSLKCYPQNGQANNNLGVLKYRDFVDSNIHFKSLIETNEKIYKSASDKNGNPIDCNNPRSINMALDQAETHFSPICADDDMFYLSHPESLFNLAVVKEKGGKLLQASKLLKLYLQQNPDNEIASKMLGDIRSMIMFDE